MPDIWMDVDTALAEVPVNILPLLDDTDFKTRETAIAYNAAGMDLVWNFVTTGGAFTQTAVTPTTAGNYDWTHQGDGMYTIEIPASGGASINNDTEGFGWFTGVVTGVLPWRGPTIGFRAAGLNNKLIDDAYDTTRALAGTALPAAAADAAGGLPISDAGGLDLDTFLGRITGNVALASVLGALNDAAVDGDPTTTDTVMQYVKQLVNTLVGTAGIPTFPASAAPANAVSLAEAIRQIYDEVAGLDGGSLANLDAAVSSRMATYTQPTGFLAATFPTTVASTTNITGGTITTVTNLTNAPTSGDLTATMKTSVQTAANDAIVALNLDKLVIASGTADSGSTTTMIDAARTEGDADYWKGRMILFTSGTLSGQCAIITDFNAGTDTFTFAPAVTQAVSTHTYVILPGISVWDDTLAEHLTAGTTGNALNAAGSAGDPWATALPGAYGAGTAGKIVGDNVNATISSRSSHSAADVWAAATRTLTAATNITSTGGTTAPQTGDNFARLGAPAGASVSADIAAVKTDTGNLVTRITATLFSGITSLAEWLGLMAGKQTGNATARTEIRATGAGSGTYTETSDSLEAIRDNHPANFSLLGIDGAGIITEVSTVGTVTTVNTLSSGAVDSIWDVANGIETSITPRQAVRYIAAATAGLLSGSQTTTEVFKGIGQASGGTTRITATVDSSGNRSAITLG